MNPLWIALSGGYSRCSGASHAAPALLNKVETARVRSLHSVESRGNHAAHANHQAAWIRIMARQRNAKQHSHLPLRSCALIFDTSFNGKDLLRTILGGGNCADSCFGGSGPVQIGYSQQHWGLAPSLPTSRMPTI